MTRAFTVRAVLALVVVAVSGWLVAVRPPQLGLDLRGGTQIVLETRDGDLAKANADTTDEALEVLRRRVDQLGVSEPSLTRSGDRRIIVELPGVTEPAQAVEVIGRTAQLTFHAVLGVAPPETPAPSAGASPGPTPSGAPTPSPSGSAPAAPGGELVLPDEQSGQRLRLGPAAIDGALIDDAQASVGQLGEWGINIEFRGRGPDAWQDLTGKAACAGIGDPTRRVAIVLDDTIISSPQVNQDVGCNVGITGGATTISGQFTPREAKDLALLVRAGGLPVPVEVIEQRTVGPTLGAAAIDASARAAVIGLIATVLFIIAVYRLVGGLAAVALVAYGLISYAALLALGATLTLPGLAGFVLAVGMAIDANVLVFERAREEYASGRRSQGLPGFALRGSQARSSRSLGQSMGIGFTKAWSAILDSNVTTLLAAGLLFFLASGPVRGFGVTLSIGVIASMFTALVLTRVLAEWVLRRTVVNRRPGISGLAGVGAVRRWLERRDPDLMGRRRIWLAVSAALVLLSLVGIGVRGVNWGVEFTGGRLVEYSTATTLDVDTARAAVAEAGLDRAVVNRSGDDNLSVRAGAFDEATEARLRAELSEAGGGEVQRLRDEKIGPSLGDELRRKALIALAVALAVQLAYLAIRFRWQWAAAAVLGMFHDVLILVGVFAWLGKAVDGVFLAAVLTVIGYSVNDSVVVFDRIRELVRDVSQKLGFAALANKGCLQTVPRTVNTGLGALFVLVALAALGRDSLVDFAVALLVGIIVGTYSSVFLATPLAVEFESRSGGLVARLDARAGAPSASRRGGKAPGRRATTGPAGEAIRPVRRRPAANARQRKG